MEEKISILEKIKSKYSILEIFNFIQNQFFKYKLFFYSKYYQKKFDLNIIDYIDLYINILGINFDNYLSFSNIFADNFDKTILSKNFGKYFDTNSNIIQNKIMNYYKEYIKNHEEKLNDFQYSQYKHFLKPISIYSPIFEILSKTDFFEELFTIKIPIKIIEKFKLEKDYISAFENLNQANSKYSSLIIKKEKNKNIDNFDYFLTSLFFIYDINNIVYLNLESFTKEIHREDFLLLKNLNNYNSLEILILNNFKFSEIFILNLTNLKVLNLSFCSNINLDKKVFLNLRKLYLIFSKIDIYQFPKLEEMYLNSEKPILPINNFNDFINLKKIIASSEDFLKLQNTSLEFVKIINSNINSIEIEKNMIIKIISIKTLKEIDFGLYYINNEEMSKIEGINNSVSTIKIFWYNHDLYCELNNLLEKFPNLISLSLYTIKSKNSRTILKIKEKSSCKITKLYLTVGGPCSNELFCKSFENLIEFELNINNEITNLKQSIPFCSKNCNVIFNSLIYLKFTTNSPYLIDYEILYNIYIKY